MSSIEIFRRAEVTEYIGEVIRETSDTVWTVTDFDIERNKVEIEKVDKTQDKVIKRHWLFLPTVQQVIINERYPNEYKAFTRDFIVRFFNL